MSNDEKDVKLARPIAIVDLWDIDDRITRLDDCVERLERIIQTIIEYAHGERVKEFEKILKEEVEKIKSNP